MSENGETQAGRGPITGLMNEIILHHYDMSPYAEKIRLILGLKGLPWRSVQIPIVMPKPRLTALTGGYRLTPVMQIGADIYCDTKIIAAQLERIAPTPTLYPPGTGALERGLSFWGESMFLPVITVFLGRGGILNDDFVEDRRKLIPGGFDMDLVKAIMPSKLDQLRAKLDLLDMQLSDGRQYVLGDLISLADFSAYHPVWAMTRDTVTQELLAPFEYVVAWGQRIAAIGHGGKIEMDAYEALEIAREASPATTGSEDHDDPSGHRPGDRLQVMPEEYGRDPVVGELVSSDAHEIALRRVDDEVGEVIVHFPRETSLILPAG